MAESSTDTQSPATSPAGDLARAFSLSPLAMTVTTLADSRLVVVNDSFVRLTGYARDEVLGRTPIELGLWVDPAIREEALRQIVSQGAVRNRETSFRVKSGAVISCLVSADLVSLDGQPSVMWVISDVTEPRQAKEELKRSRRMFERILEATPDLVFIYDCLDSSVVYTNRLAERVLGISLADLQSMDVEWSRSLIHPDDGDRVRAEVASRVDLGEHEIAETEFRLRDATGAWRWLRRRDSSFLRGPDGKVTQFVGVARDITEEKAHGDAVRRSEERLRLATEAARVAIYDVDLVSNRVSCTPRLFEITGMRETPAPSMAELRALVHPDDRERVERDFDRAIEGDGQLETEHRLIRPSGEVRWVIVRGRTLFAEVGGARRPVRASGAMVDVTDWKLAQESLRHSEALFRSLADTAPTMIWTAAPDGQITFRNEQWTAYCGVPAGHTAPGWDQILHPDDRDRCLAQWRTCLAEGTDYETEARIRGRDGEYRWFLTRATPVRDAARRITAWCGSTTDIHDKKQAEETRERLLVEMADHDRRKDQFLAMLSHELRNPLAPIRNAVHLLRLEPSDPAKTSWAHDVLDRQVEQLSHLVDDLLDISRISSGKVRLETQPVDVATIISRALEASRPLIEGRRHQLTVAYPVEPAWIAGDAVRLTQVVTNLLVNAAKFTEQGGRIWLTTEHADGWIVLSIRDTGVGIAPELIPRVFDIFTQADRSLESADGGLGLGLSLVRSLVELHRGTVEALSDGANRGSQFIVRLPTIPAPAMARRSVRVREESGGRAARVLVVDDNRDFADTTALLLELGGHEVRVAFDGEEALEQAETFQPGAVLLDVGLPGMDGYEVARRIAERPGSAKPVLIAMTGHGMPEDRSRSKDSGFRYHLVKPIDFTLLQRVLEESRT